MKRILLILFALALFRFPAAAQGNATARNLAWSPDNQYVAVYQRYDGPVQIYDTRSGSPTVIQVIQIDFPNVLRFTPDSRSLIVGDGNPGWGSGGSIGVWDIQTGENTASFPANRFTMYTLAINPAGTLVAGGGGLSPLRGGGDYRVRLWDAVTWEPLGTIDDRFGHIDAVAFNSDGRYLMYSREYDGNRLYDVAAGEIVGVIYGEAADWILFDDERSRVILGTYTGYDVYELRQEPELYFLRQPQQWLDDLHITRDDPNHEVIGVSTRYVAITSLGGILSVHDFDSGEILYQYEAPGMILDTAVFSPDDRRLAFLSTPENATDAKPQLVIWDFAGE